MLPFRHRYKSYNTNECFKYSSDSTTPKMNLKFYLFDQSFNELVYVLFFFTVCFALLSIKIRNNCTSFEKRKFANRWRIYFWTFVIKFVPNGQNPRRNDSAIKTNANNKLTLWQKKIPALSFRLDLMTWCTHQERYHCWHIFNDNIKCWYFYATKLLFQTDVCSVAPDVGEHTVCVCFFSHNLLNVDGQTQHSQKTIRSNNLNMVKSSVERCQINMAITRSFNYCTSFC